MAELEWRDRPPDRRKHQGISYVCRSAHPCRCAGRSRLPGRPHPAAPPGADDTRFPLLGPVSATCARPVRRTAIQGPEWDRSMAHGKHSARLEEWLTDLRVLIMWALRDRQPHGREELAAWLITSLNMGWVSKKLPKDLGDAHERITTELHRLVS